LSWNILLSLIPVDNYKSDDDDDEDGDNEGDDDLDFGINLYHN